MRRDWKGALKKNESKLVISLDRKIDALKRSMMHKPSQNKRDQLDLLRMRRHRLQMRASTRARRVEVTQ